MSKLDWTKIDNDKLFQDMVNDLVWLELGKPGFLASSSLIGKDGAWDGRFEQEYQGISGLWSVQSKWTKKNLDDAFPGLTVELKKELDNAAKNNVDNLIFATNAELRIGKDDPTGKLTAHVGELEKLNTGQVKNLIIWPRANLQLLIERWPWLKNKYFDYPQYPVFVPVSDYIATYEKDILPVSIIGRKEDLKKILEFTNDDKNKILIMHAQGGSGKSHTLKEISEQIMSGTSNKRQPWFYRPIIGKLEDAINTELDSKKNYLLILDDAERYIEDTKKLIAFAKSSPAKNIKLLLSTRSSGYEIVENLLKDQRVFEYDKIELSNLTESELLEILSQASENSKIEHPDRLIKDLNYNPFLVVTTGKLVKRGMDPEKAKEHIKLNLEKDFNNALAGIINDRQVASLLKELSVIVPIPLKDPQTTNKLAEILSLDVKIIEEIFAKLLKTGVLRQVGSTLRFNADMVGDIYLSILLDQQDGEDIANELLQKWLPISAEKITANLGAAGRHSDTESANKTISAFIQTYVNNAQKTSNIQRSQNLEIIKHIVFLAPEKVLDLIYAYLQSSNQAESYPLGRDDYGPIIARLLRIPGYQKPTLAFIKLMAEKGIKGTYNNYEPKNLIREAVSPIEIRYFKSIANSLDEIHAWITNPSCSLAEAGLACAAIKETLAGSHEYRDNYGITLTVGRRTIQVVKQVHELRDKAIEIIKTLVSHPKVEIRKLGVEVIGDIGDEALSKDGDLWKRIVNDKDKGLDLIALMLESTTDDSLVNEAETILIRIWANNDTYPELAAKAGLILNKIEKTSEYKLYGYFVSKDLVFADFKAIEALAPTKNRWSWLVHNHFRNYELDQQQFELITKPLADKYKTPKDLLLFLNELDKKIGKDAQWGYVPVIETWYTHNPLVFKEIKKQNLIREIPFRFHRGIHRVLTKIDPKYIHEYAEALTSASGDLTIENIDYFLDLLIEYKPPLTDFLPWLKTLAANPDSKIKNIILHRAYFIFKDLDDKERKKIYEVIKPILENAKSEEVIDMLEFLLHNAKGWGLDPENFEELKQKLLSLLKDLPKIDYHGNELLGIAVDNNLKNFIAFIDHRLGREKAAYDAGENKFDAIPYDGFKILDELVKTYEEFAELTDNVMKWQLEEKLYSFDVDHIMKNLTGKQDVEHGNYLDYYINEKINRGDKKSIEEGIISLHALTFGKSSSGLYLKVLIEAEKSGLLDKAREVFAHEVVSGGYTSTFGEAPPALVKKKEALEDMKQNAPHGVIKTIIDNLLKNIELDIQTHLQHGEEMVNPKN